MTPRNDNVGLYLHVPFCDRRCHFCGFFTRARREDRVAAFETVTPGYTMVNANLAWRPWGTARPVSIYLSANNLFNVEARRHASFLKDYAPLAGRAYRVVDPRGVDDVRHHILEAALQRTDRIGQRVAKVDLGRGHRTGAEFVFQAAKEHVVRSTIVEPAWDEEQS